MCGGRTEFNERSFCFITAIVQNDDIKEEITNDSEGLLLVARCAYEPHLDLVTIQRPALRIIDAISFVNNSAVEQIKENDILMDHIKELSKRNDKYQAETVNRILWKVEKESEFVSKQEIRKKRNRINVKKIFNEKEAIYQYVRGDYRFNLTDDEIAEKFDIMISYCQDDKEICQKIYDHLKELDLYKISFDVDNFHNGNPEAMAKVVENSAIFIMCFSTKYRNSYACRLEAEYAEKRQRPIIPVKVEPRYDPTGWLHKTIGNKQYVDFTQSKFNSSFEQLIDEINETNEELDKT